MYVRVCLYVCACVCVRVCVCACVGVCAYLRVHVWDSACVCLCMCVLVCMRMHNNIERQILRVTQRMSANTLTHLICYVCPYTAVLKRRQACSCSRE